MGIDEFKGGLSGKPAYVLRHANVWVHPTKRYHVIDHLDPGEVDGAIDHDKLTGKWIWRFESHSRTNKAVFNAQADMLRRFGGDLGGRSILDVGCGPGDLLVALRDRHGMVVEGVEPDDRRASFAERFHGLKVRKNPVEDDRVWQDRARSYDFVTLWDVLEHVNYPDATFDAAAALVKPGGLLVVGTPCRDSFYHRFGVATYRISKGRYPTFLDIMYSNQAFGHKQILSMAELRSMYSRCRMEVLHAERRHELSYPHAQYIDSLVKSPTARRMAKTACAFVWDRLPITNKMIFVGRNPTEAG